MKSRIRAGIALLPTALLAAALALTAVAGCGSKSEVSVTRDWEPAARQAAEKAATLASFAEDAQLAFAFIHANHTDDATLTLAGEVVGADYRLTVVRSGMGLASGAQWTYAGGKLYRGDGATWTPADATNADPPPPPRRLLEELGSFQVTAPGADTEWEGALCHTYSVSCDGNVVWFYAPVWLRELDANLDFRCKGDIYVGAKDGLPRRISLRLEGTERGTGLLKLSVNLDAGYSRFNDATLTVADPALTPNPPPPGS